MRFLNVSRSDKLEEMFLLYADSDTNVVPWVGMPDSIQDSFPQHDLPYMFQKYEVPSSFITNFGDDFTGLTLKDFIFQFFIWKKKSTKNFQNQKKGKRFSG